MAAKFDMSWEPGRKRWWKMHRGKRYVVSCRQLGTTPTKEASYQQANAWWKAKLAEIGSSSAEHPHEAVIQELKRRRSWARQNARDEVQALDEELKEVQALDERHDDPVIGLPTAHEREMLSQFGIHVDADADPLAVAAILGRNRIWEDRLKREESPADPDRSIGAFADKYYALHDARHRSGGLSAAECDTTRKMLRPFIEFIGGDSSIDSITPLQWEGYYNLLMKRLGAREISAVTAKKHFSYARRFLGWLVSLGLVPALPNLRSRTYKFPKGVKTPPTFTVAEVQQIVSIAKDPLKLHILLMANCGFCQADIGDLLKSEVDYEKGTITRQRSKTRIHHEENVPTVTWKLWPITLELLRRLKSQHPTLALTTKRGKPWCEERLDENGKRRRRDAIEALYKPVREELNLDKPLKVLRKTSASLLDHSNEYARFTQLFLAHAATSVAEINYQNRSQERFDDAVAWLGKEYGFLAAE